MLGFIKLFREDVNLMTIVLLTVGLISGILLCIYIAFKRVTPTVLVEGVKWVWKYPKLRPIAIGILILLPFLVVGGIIYKCNIDNNSFLFNVPAHNNLITDIQVESGDFLEFSASGKWYWGRGENECSDPVGTHGRPHPDEYPVTLNEDGVYFGTLIGKIGNNPPFKIGSRMEYKVPSNQQGKLILLMNDRINCYMDNHGSIQVVLKIKKAK